MPKKTKNAKSITTSLSNIRPIVLLSTILIAILIGGVILLVTNSKKDHEVSPITEQQRQPETPSKSAQNNPTNKNQEKDDGTVLSPEDKAKRIAELEKQALDELENVTWKTYQNNQLGISFKYPVFSEDQSSPSYNQKTNDISLAHGRISTKSKKAFEESYNNCLKQSKEEICTRGHRRMNPNEFNRHVDMLNEALSDCPVGKASCNKIHDFHFGCYALGGAQSFEIIKGSKSKILRTLQACGYDISIYNHSYYAVFPKNTNEIIEINFLLFPSTQKIHRWAAEQTGSNYNESNNSYHDDSKLVSAFTEKMYDDLKNNIANEVIKKQIDMYDKIAESITFY